MKIAFASSEVVPYAKTGGLADVAGSLPKELAAKGHDVKVFMPKYYPVDEFKYNLEYVEFIGEMKIRVGGWPHSAWVYQGKLPDSDVDIYFIHNPHYFHRHSVYTSDWDEDERFIFFSKAVIETIQHLGWAPDVINCNDWQTALIPLYVRDNYNWDRMFDKTATVFTIHNIGYQGNFGTDTLHRAEINPALFYTDGPVEHYGDVNFMKAGIVYADKINTVSETYANELMTPEYGISMDPVLRRRQHDFMGIINGVDYSVWSPEEDKYLPHKFSKDNLNGKLENKKHLLEQVGLPFERDVPTIGIVSRMVPQKGFDIIAQAVYGLMGMNCQWLILGNGEHKYESLFNSMQRNYPHKAVAYIGYSNELAHLIEAGADMFLMPSLYEPCGLNQIYSLKYGTVPIVRKTGGLADTVQDWDEYNSYGMNIGNGFTFEAPEGYALEHAVRRALKYFNRKDVWYKIMMNGMSRDYSWSKSADKYIDLYKSAISNRRNY